MNTLSEKGQALRFIEGMESGTMSPSDGFNILKDRDPVLVYFLLRYLKEKYGPGHPDSKALGERLIALTGTYDELPKMLRKGEQDAMREWFDDSHSVREFARDPDAFVELIVDKLEG